MASKSFAEWSAEKRQREGKTVNGKTFSEWREQKERNQEYAASVVPHSADYLNTIDNIAQQAKNDQLMNLAMKRK